MSQWRSRIMRPCDLLYDLVDASNLQAGRNDKGLVRYIIKRPFRGNSGRKTPPLELSC